MLLMSAAAQHSTCCFTFPETFQGSKWLQKFVSVWQVLYSPSFLLQMCNPVFFCISLFLASLLSEPLVGWTKPVHKCKKGFEKHILQCTKRNWRWICIEWQVLHKLCAIVCKVFKLFYFIIMHSLGWRSCPLVALQRAKAWFLFLQKN